VVLSICKSLSRVNKRLGGPLEEIIGGRCQYYRRLLEFTLVLETGAMVLRRSLKCPCCGRDLEFRNLNFSEAFACPHCQRELKVSRVYSTFFGLLGLAASYAILYEIGLRDLSLLAGGFVGWFPVIFIELRTLNRLFPPELIPVDESIVQ